MRQQRKRCRTSQDLADAGTRISSQNCRFGDGECSSAVKLQDPKNAKVDKVLADGASSVSKCSVKLIGEVVSKFNQLKKDLVKSIGFEGILYFPHVKQFNRKFTLWLMTSVNQVDATINIAPDISIKFDKKDIGYVLGVPVEGKVVLDPLASTREAKDKVIQEFLGDEFKEHRRIKIVQEIVERDYGDNICKVDSDRFKVAFVVFVVSNLLAPSCKYGYASVDYWNAIKDPDDIGSFDWAGFVFTKLIEGVTKLKQDIANNIKFPNITGCVMFLQVLYLDSLDIETLSMMHSTLPRVRDFTFDRIRAMIRADQNFKRHINGDNDIPVGKLRNEADCIYSWAVAKRHTEPASRLPCLQSLNIPIQAAGPLFIVLSKLQDQVNSGVFVNVAQATRFLNVVASLLVPYTRGLRNVSSYINPNLQDGNQLLQPGTSNGNSLVSYSLSNIAVRGNMSLGGRSLDELLHSALGSGMESGVHSCESTRCVACFGVQRCLYASSSEVCCPLNISDVVASTMSHCYAAIWNVKSANDLDLNAVVSSGSGSSSSSSVVPSDEFVMLSPWQLGYEWDFSEVSTQNFCNEINHLLDEHSLAIVHRDPKYIQVSMDAMALQFLGKCEMELDMFDSLVRLARQRDDLLFSSYGTMRWRYIFESDFMFGILSGAFDLMDCRLHNYLSISDLGYDLTQNKIVFFPALIRSQWVCFAWLPQSNIIWVFEPSFSLNLPEGRLILLERSSHMLKLALRTLSSTVFKGVCQDVSLADIRIMNLADTRVSRVNSSGLLCSMFYRCFDGWNLNPNVQKVDAQRVAAKLFNEIRDLKENTGSLNCRF